MSERQCAHRYPRVLVVNGSAFGEHSPTAITLTNLFRGWPSDEIALAHFDPVARNPGGGFCSQVWKLSLADVPVDRTVRKLLGDRKEHFFGRAGDGAPGGRRAFSARNGGSLRTGFHAVASAWADLLLVQPSGDFWKWVADFRPEVIYSMLGKVRIIQFVRQVARYCDKPVVPHFMDDWPSTYYRGWLNAVPRRAMLVQLRSLIGRAPLGMGISPVMAAEYERRYSIPFYDFMNCVSVPEVNPAEGSPAHSPLRFTYIGGLHNQRRHVLEEIGQALLSVSREGCSAELVIHAPERDIRQHGVALSALPSVRVGPTLSQDQLVPAMRDADVLVHVDSFGQEVRDYLRLSLSTKLPQYMASGRAILAYGPGELATFKYVQDAQCGIVVGDRNGALLLKAVRTLALDPQTRAALGRRGWQVAMERHKAEKVREQFRDILSLACGSSRESPATAPVPLACDSRA